jgi:predicted ATPase/DNA-binding winged helix-turn-helix (wHTH) protein
MTPIQLQHCTVDLQRNQVHRGEEVLVLTTKETQLLAYLMERAGVVVSRDELFTAVWGYDEKVVSRAVDTTVRRLRTKIESDPKQPDHVITVHGEGYRFAPLVGALGIPAAHIAATVSEPIAGADPCVILPAHRSTLFGRQAELAAVSELIADGARLVTIVGPGGMGKSRVASAYGTAHAASFPGGVYRCALHEMDRATGLLEHLASTLDIRLGASGEVSESAQRIGSVLAQRAATLLILDDFDGLVGRAEDVLVALVEAAPDATLLVTTRTRLEQASARVIQLEALPTEDAIALFVDRSAQLRPRLSRTPEMDEVLGALVDKLDGMPLAIELAAARSRVLSPEQLLIRLAHSYTLLEHNARGVAPRHHGLQAMLAAAWEELTASEQAILGGCTVFRGGFTLEAAEATLASLVKDVPIIDEIETLVDGSWLQIEEAAADLEPVRFRQYATIRAFIERQSITAQLRQPAQRAHAEWYLTSGERLADQLYTHRGPKDVRWLTKERENLLAIATAQEGVTLEAAARATRMMILTDITRHSYVELNAFLDSLDGLPSDLEPAVAATTLLSRAFAKRFLGRTAEADADARAAMPIALEHGDADLSCEAHFVMACLYWDRGQADPALEHLAEVERIEMNARSAAWGLRRITMQMQVAARTGRLDDARRLGRRGMELAAGKGAQRTEALLHQCLSWVEADLGDFEAAIKHARKGAAFFAALQDRLSQGFVQNDLGALYAIRGDPEKALESFNLALGTFEKLGIRVVRAVVLGNRGALKMQMGELLEADRELRTCLELYELGGFTRGRGYYLGYWGAVRALLGDQDQAQRLFEEGRAALKDSDFRWADEFIAPLEAHIAIGRARLARAEGDGATEREQLDQARSIAASWKEMRSSAVVFWARALLDQAILRMR